MDLLYQIPAVFVVATNVTLDILPRVKTQGDILLVAVKSLRAQLAKWVTKV